MLASNEKKFSTIEKEMLAYFWAVNEFRMYLWGNKFVLRTFNFDCQYKPGVENIIPDYLSRSPTETTCEAQSYDIDDEDQIVASIDWKAIAFTRDELMTAAQTCEEQEQIREMVTNGWPKTKKQVPDALRPYYNIKNEITEVDGMLVRLRNRIIVPREIRGKVLDLAHEGHQGIVRTKQRLRKL